jgi:hypothetical protein
MRKLFEKGNPGGPGRPRGRRNSINRVLDRLAASGAPAVLKMQIDRAEKGDSRAAEMVLRRVWALPRGRPVDIDLPAVEKAADIVPAHAAVMAALAARTITPEEAMSVSMALDAQRRAFEVGEFERRMEAFEARIEKRLAESKEEPI